MGAGGQTGGAATTPAANSFADPLNKYLSSAAPSAPGQATMGTNRFAGGLTQAEQRLQDLINNPSALQDSASYKFRVQQGQEALQRSLGAKGLLRSGNRLTELTNYGQNMGAQEYEAENARRMALLNSYAGNYNTDQGNNINLYNTQQGSLDKQYGIASDAYNTRGTTLANLYGNQNQADTTRYATDVGANTARANTLADLYKTDTSANAAWNTNQLGWAENQTKNLDWAYKSEIERQNAMARVNQQQARMGPAPRGFTTEF